MSPKTRNVGHISNVVTDDGCKKLVALCNRQRLDHFQTRATVLADRSHDELCQGQRGNDLVRCMVDCLRSGVKTFCELVVIDTQQLDLRGGIRKQINCRICRHIGNRQLALFLRVRSMRKLSGAVSLRDLKKEFCYQQEMFVVLIP